MSSHVCPYVLIRPYTSVGLQEEAITVERETREATLRALARKVDETERLKSELEASCANVSTEIATSK